MRTGALSAPGRSRRPQRRGARWAGPAACGPAAPPPGEIRCTDDYELFWSLSFAVRREVFDQIGGFDAGYTGYGAEDTDFAQHAPKPRDPAVLGRRCGGLPSAPSGLRPAGGASGLDSAQCPALPPQMGVLADARLAGGLRRARPGTPGQPRLGTHHRSRVGAGLPCLYPSPQSA
ncbi:galactosyltransferase-related protein [Nesterenkonia sp.]|uniref:glycosyltransferase family 2 protein n=1 Tax=Nesterenkonia sp. TaxID=704201 RepID=UPI002608D520|nr:galactosyltransferase-related protein [Nesterenkonia sp.]